MEAEHFPLKHALYDAIRLDISDNIYEKRHGNHIILN